MRRVPRWESRFIGGSEKIVISFTRVTPGPSSAGSPNRASARLSSTQTVLYSGGRRTAADSLKTAAEHGFTEDYLGCPILIGDGADGRDVLEIPAGFRHFPAVQVASVIHKAEGFVIFSHFKGHLESSFGGAIKNLSMGFASRAQKQRMHADAHPVLNPSRCTRCGLCVEVCPAGAARMSPAGYSGLRSGLLCRMLPVHRPVPRDGSEDLLGDGRHGFSGENSSKQRRPSGRRSVRKPSSSMPSFRSLPSATACRESIPLSRRISGSSEDIIRWPSTRPPSSEQVRSPSTGPIRGCRGERQFSYAGEIGFTP